MIFIPPQLAEQVVKTAEIVQLRDMFGHLRLKEGKYTPGQIDARWSDEIERDFSEWLKMSVGEVPVPKLQMQELLKERARQIHCGPGGARRAEGIKVSAPDRKMSRAGSCPVCMFPASPSCAI
jgi:hypothetical protein